MAGENRENTFVGLTARRVSGQAKLYSLLARVFSYPDCIKAMAYTSVEFLDICEGFVRQAQLPSGVATEAVEAFRLAAQEDAEERAHDLRVAHTQLFVAPPRPVKLAGSYWVHNRTLVSEEQGERFAVGEVYRELGLRTKKGVSHPADHLVSELDCMHYLARAEARAWRGDDLAMARDWHQLQEDFVTYHLFELAQGVADGVERLSSNAHMRYFAALLRATVEGGLQR